MDFVAAAANLRAIAFGIAQKSRFDIKCEQHVHNIIKTHTVILPSKFIQNQLLVEAATYIIIQ